MPLPIEKLQKFLKLEAERHFDNRAVVGGLDKILPVWEQEAREAGIGSELVDQIVGMIRAYPQKDPAAREELVNSILNLVRNEAAVELAEQPVPAQQTPAQTEPLPAAPVPAPAPAAPPEVVAPAPAAPAAPAVDILKEPEEGISLDQPVTVLPRVGKKNSHRLEQIGIRTVEDALHYYPSRFVDYSKLKPLNRIEYGEELTVAGAVVNASTRPIRGGKMRITEAVITDGTASLRLTWFNKPYLNRELTPGRQITVSGKVDMYLGRPVMTEPDFEPIEKEHLHTNRIVPVYPLGGDITQKWLRDVLHGAVENFAPRVADPLPKEIRREAGLVNLPTALSQVHFPDTHENLEAARARLAFDEIFLLQLGVASQKRAWQAQTARPFTVPDDWFEQQLARLPYQLTGAQQQAIATIRADLASTHPMNRLLQGDVGSGKTVVAALAASIVANNGAQVAIMAPTGILAEQHFHNFQDLLSSDNPDEGYPLRPEEIALLVGDTPEAEKQRIREGLAAGDIKIVVGTHALIEGPIVFNQLQLAIIDEQHRFGVAQRALLRSKGDNPHLLVMTATPIPRSLALTLYGDLDLSILNEMPPGRQPVSTHLLSPLERERAYQLIRSQAQKGNQAFIIYPLVEEGENGEGQAAVNEHARLQKEVLPDLRLGLLHGRMKPEEKDQVMTRFRTREYDVLVSTTVIEVGVDVPNATVMLIEGANRFGLAQLHQLRGRVGRGKQQSYCLLIPETQDSLENERLRVMVDTNDGFVLAERDLELRGPGDFLGTRQSGLAELRMAKLSDVHLIEKARRLAQALFERDPDLSAPQHRLLRKALDEYWGDGRGDIS